jgi:hypothetical protein
MSSDSPATPPPTAGAGGAPIDWRVVLKGALVGLAVIVPVTVLRVVLDREITDFDDSGWIYPLFVLILVGYVTAGWVAGRAEPQAPLTHGILAGFGIIVLWIPIRVVIWLVREDGRGLFTGKDPALAPGALFAAFVLAAGLGAAGAALGAYTANRRTRESA